MPARSRIAACTACSWARTVRASASSTRRWCTRSHARADVHARRDDVAHRATSTATAWSSSPRRASPGGCRSGRARVRAVRSSWAARSARSRARSRALREADANATLQRRLRSRRDAPRRTWSTTSQEQRAATGTLPTDRDITIERFRDELGDWRVCILTPFGARVHAPWALALRAIVVRAARLRCADGLERRRHRAHDRRRRRAARRRACWSRSRRGRGAACSRSCRGSPLFASQFRENAARALLLPRRRPGQRTPLFAQRLRAQQADVDRAASIRRSRS